MNDRQADARFTDASQWDSLQSNFLEFFSGKTVRSLVRTTLRPYEQDSIPKGEEVYPYFQRLFERVRSHEYFPGVPRAYDVLDKGGGVPRVVPVLEFDDLAIFYFCCRYLEKSISSGRVERTYGGYNLSSMLRNKELEEMSVYQEEWEESRAAEMADYSYFGSGSVRPNIWVKEWKEFQRVSYQIVTTKLPHFALKYDISNFYDNIPLDKLEARLRRICKREEHIVIDLLFVFLRNWNRSHEGYGGKTVGIPQDESGESSRLLANTYLQNYDHWLKSQADKIGAIYLRYSDDQVLFGANQRELTQLMYRAGLFLRKDGLNINSGKVTLFDDIREYGAYWSYEWFAELDADSSPDKVEEITLKFLDRCENGDLNWRWEGLMKRIITLGIPKSNPLVRERFLKFLMQPERITRLTDWHFKRLFSSFTEHERIDLLNLIDLVSPNVPFNMFHLYLRKFYLNFQLVERAEQATYDIEDRSLHRAIAD